MGKKGVLKVYLAANSDVAFSLDIVIKQTFSKQRGQTQWKILIMKL